MGKNNKKKNNKSKNKKKNNNTNSIFDVSTNNADKKYPFVSICTPTFNRRPFIKYMIKCFEHQTYPKERMEWIIIDDGSDKIKDLVEHIPQVKYFEYDQKKPLGEKRNIMHEKSSGDIIVYMDDDDYYPPQRVEHAVHMLTTHKKALCAGASEIYIYFKHINQMVQFGPYGPNHATAGTFAFKRELLNQCKYENTASLAEEKAFLKNYTIPFVQLEPKKTILVFSHRHNTFDKRKLLDNPHPNFVKNSDKKVNDFVKEPELENFYVNEIDGLLEQYKPGDPSMKPDVLKQMIQIEESRRKHIEELAMKQQKQGQIVITNGEGKQQPLNNEQVVTIIRDQQAKIKELTGNLQSAAAQLNEMNRQIQHQSGMINSLQQQNENLISKMSDSKNK